MLRLLLIASLFVTSLLVSAQETSDTLTLVTHDSFNVSEDVLEQFTEETGIKVEILRAGDAGQLVNQSVLTAGNPLGDVLFGVDNTFLSRALNADLFIPYEAEGLENVDEQFMLDDEFRVTPIDYGDVCLNYDIAYVEENDIPLPETLADLTEPEYRGLLVGMNPATSSPGLAFLLATINEFGEPSDDNEYDYLDYWTDLVANDMLITDGWSDAYFGYFTAASEDGTYPFVVSYASSPPFTYDEALDDATTDSIVGDGMCFRQIEFAGILAGTDNEAGAQQFIEFLLSREFQEDMPMQMFVFPVNEEAELPEVFEEYASIPESPAVLSYDEIEENRDDWISAWTETVLR